MRAGPGAKPPRGQSSPHPRRAGPGAEERGHRPHCWPSSHTEQATIPGSEAGTWGQTGHSGGRVPCPPPCLSAARPLEVPGRQTQPAVPMSGRCLTEPPGHLPHPDLGPHTQDQVGRASPGHSGCHPLVAETASRWQFTNPRGHGACGWPNAFASGSQSLGRRPALPSPWAPSLGPQGGVSPGPGWTPFRPHGPAPQAHAALGGGGSSSGERCRFPGSAGGELGDPGPTGRGGWVTGYSGWSDVHSGPPSPCDAGSPPNRSPHPSGQHRTGPRGVQVPGAGAQQALGGPLKLDHYLPSALCADPAGTSQGAGGTCDLCFAQAATHCPSPGPGSRAGPPPGLTGEWGGRAGSASCPRSPGGHGLLAECPLRRAPVTRQPGPRTVLSRLVQTWFPGKRPLRLPGLCPESLICTGRQGALPTLHRTPTPRPVRRLSCHLPGHQGGGGRGSSAHTSRLAVCPPATWTARGGRAAHGHVTPACAQEWGLQPWRHRALARVPGGAAGPREVVTAGLQPARPFTQVWGWGQALPESRSTPPAPPGGSEG